jgi:hypothetical protein
MSIARNDYVISSSQNTRNELLFEDLVIRAPSFRLSTRKKTLLKFARKFNLFDFELFESDVDESSLKIFPFFLFRTCEKDSHKRNITRLFDDETNIFVQRLCNMFFQDKIALNVFLSEIFQMTSSFQHINISNLHVFSETALPINIYKHIFPKVKFDFHKFNVEWMNHPPLQVRHEMEHDSLVVFQGLSTTIFGNLWAHVYFALFLLSRTISLNIIVEASIQEKFIVFKQLECSSLMMERFR